MILSTRLATPEDRAHLLTAVASTASPLQLAHAVDTLLAHPSVHPCFLVETGEVLAGVVPITLVPHLMLGGLVAWLPAGVMLFTGDMATREAALAAVNEYARAHGILHVLILGESVTTVTGAIFVICVLTFRRGIMGEIAARVPWLRR